MKKLLFLCNGHGEDTIAASLIKLLLKKNPALEISVLPLVGEGQAFEKLPVEILGPRQSLPSGGFLYQNFKLMLKDIFSGLLGNTLTQIKILRKLKKQFELVFAVGDIVPLVGALLTKCPFMFYGCAKSDYYSYSYTPWEKWLLKKYCLLVLPRDLKTTENLKRAGIKAEYLGNPMMDDLPVTGENFGIGDEVIKIGILPGSRQDAYLNTKDIAQMIPEIVKQKTFKNEVSFLLALAPNLDTAKLPALPENVAVIQGKFGDVLNQADLIIGLSGTGNEQAMGLGKPVVTFPGRGIQHTQKFARMKKELLGQAGALVERDAAAVAKEIWQILSSPERLKKAKETGLERMGKPGATKVIVEKILSYLNL